jgi:hypothetical protein
MFGLRDQALAGLGECARVRVERVDLADEPAVDFGEDLDAGLELADAFSESVASHERESLMPFGRV